MKQKRLIFFLASIISVAILSCGTLIMDQYYFVKLYDENNKQITDLNRTKDFKVTLVDNSPFKGYKGSVDISLQEVVNEPYYFIVFSLGNSAIKLTQDKYEKRFKDASKFMKIKVEDGRGEYKGAESPALSEYKYTKSGKSAVPEINIKLEKK